MECWLMPRSSRIWRLQNIFFVHIWMIALLKTLIQNRMIARSFSHLDFASGTAIWNMLVGCEIFLNAG